MPVATTSPGYANTDAGACAVQNNVLRSNGAAASRHNAAPSIHSTNAPGTASDTAVLRAKTIEELGESGHGTRPIHAASAQTTSASATRGAAVPGRRLSSSMSSPASAHPAH